MPSAASLLTDRRGHGEGLIAWNLFSRLARHGHDLVVCARAADLSVPPPFQLVETGPASRLESIEPLAYARRIARVFRQLGGARRFDLVHWLFPQGREEMLSWLPRSVPFVAGPRLLTWPAAPRRRAAGDLLRLAAGPLFGALHERALETASSLLVSVPEAVEGVPERFRSKTRVLPFGVDVLRFRDSDPRPGATVVFVGKLEAEKGVRELVEAFPRVKERVPASELLIAGEGGEEGWIRARASRLGLDGSLELLGPVPNAKLPALLERASLVCLPSRGEPFGMTVLEAMACGRPVVAVDAGGPRYLLDGAATGQLVPPNDVGALAEALVGLLRDPARLAELGRRNRERVEATFSLERVVDQLEGVYRDAVAGPVP